MRVLIAGGGIGGPCLAQGLKKAGVDFALFEREPEIGRSGYRLHMNGDGGGALQQCLPENLYELYLETSRVNPRRELAVMIDSHLNEISSRPHIGPPNPGDRPHTAVNRKTLRQILLFGIEDKVHYGRHVVGYLHDADKVRVLFEDGTYETGDVLVGADGINSVVRTLRLPDTKPIDTGMRMIYGRTPLTAAQLSELPDVLRDGFIAATDSEQSFIGLGLFNARQDPAVAAAKLAPSLVLESVPDYLMIAYGAIGKSPLPDDELFTARGETLSQLIAHSVRDWHPTLRSLISAVDPGSCFPQTVRRLPVTPDWQPSRVTLIGDAIHAMPPSFGAGANTALWDAGVLVQQLRAAAAGSCTVTEAVGAYEAAMREHVFPILRDSSSMASEPDDSDDFMEMPAEIAARFQK